MSYISEVRRLCGNVVSDTPSGLVDPCQVRHLTSKPSAAVRTYTAWIDASGLFTQGRETELFDAEKNSYKK
jgi:hypothetical protein